MAEQGQDFFGTYLSTVRPATQRTGPRPPLLALVRAHSTPMRYADLWHAAYEAGYSQQQFATAFRELLTSHLLAVRPVPGDQSNPWVELSGTGNEVVKAATS